MYTQCSKCETIFRLSADVLRAAGGQVRCGKCGEVFNALARLAEDATTFESGESSLEMETRADNILQSIPSLPMAAPAPPETDESILPGVEIAHLEILGASGDGLEGGESSLEFTLPPGELDRIFVETKMRARSPLPLDAAAIPPAAGTAAEIAEQIADAQAAPANDLDPVLPPHPESVAPDRRAPNEVSAFEVPDNVRRQMLAGIEEDAQTATAVRMVSRGIEGRRLGSRPSFILWLTAAAVSTLLLVFQIAHRNQEWVATPANLSAYQLRQWGVTGDPAANGTLRVRASILNMAAQLQPYPLLRVTLADRFGNRIGSRDFEPSEYLGKPTARLLAPGERADATLDILDPGKNAEGFEIDVCLRRSDKKIACANDVALQTNK